MNPTKTIYLDDYSMDKLNAGYSVRIGDVLITFSPESKRATDKTEVTK